MNNNTINFDEHGGTATLHIEPGGDIAAAVDEILQNSNFPANWTVVTSVVYGPPDSTPEMRMALSLEASAMTDENAACMIAERIKSATGAEQGADTATVHAGEDTAAALAQAAAAAQAAANAISEAAALLPNGRHMRHQRWYFHRAIRASRSAHLGFSRVYRSAGCFNQYLGDSDEAVRELRLLARRFRHFQADLGEAVRLFDQVTWGLRRLVRDFRQHSDAMAASAASNPD